MCKNQSLQRAGYVPLFLCKILRERLFFNDKSTKSKNETPSGNFKKRHDHLNSGLGRGDYGIRTNYFRRDIDRRDGR